MKEIYENVILFYIGMNLRVAALIHSLSDLKNIYLVNKLLSIQVNFYFRAINDKGTVDN